MQVSAAFPLPQQPQAVACLIRYLFSRPALLIFDYQAGIPVLSAWTGRGLTGLISVRCALKAFIRRMPKQFELSGKAVPKDRDETQKNEQTGKKSRKKSRNTNKPAAKKPAADAKKPDENPNDREEKGNESET